MSLDAALGFVLSEKVEGGYANDPSDPGGETKYGISKRAYPDVDIANLTIAGARVLYERDYWNPLHGNELPRGLAFCMFDFSVNSGIGIAVRTLQRLIGEKDDGLMGLKTMAAARRNAGSEDLLESYCADRIIYLSELPTWKRYRRGWTRRVLRCSKEAARQ